MICDSNFLEKIKLLEQNFKYNFTEMQLKNTFNFLNEENITDEDFNKGIKKLLLENKYMPVLSDIINACKLYRDDKIYQEQKTVSKEDAYKFFNDPKNSDIAKDCIELIRKKLNGLITIDNYIAEMYNFDKKYQGIGFLESVNKLKHQIKVKV